MIGTLGYDVALFDRARIERMSSHFVQLLSAATADPSAPLAMLTMLTDGERDGVLQRWNETSAPFRTDATLQGLFEEQVLRTPDAPAVWCGAEHLTYFQVQEKARRLGATLRRLGAGPGSFVSIYIHRDLEMIPALLGILKSGAAYVPIEPDHPDARTASILTSLRVRHVVTQTDHVPKLRSLAPQIPHVEHLVCLDGPADSAVAGSG